MNDLIAFYTFEDDHLNEKEEQIYKYIMWEYGKVFVACEMFSTFVEARALIGYLQKPLPIYIISQLTVLRHYLPKLVRAGAYFPSDNIKIRYKYGGSLYDPSRYHFSIPLVIR